MKLCVMMLSVPWYMFNGLEYPTILSHFLTFIAGSSSRLLRIRFSADLTMYWFPLRHFRCMQICPLVIWIWNQNIAISTIVGTSSHIKKYAALDNSRAGTRLLKKKNTQTMFEYRHTYNNINRDRSRGERGSCTPIFKSARVEKGEAKLCFCFPLNLANELETVEIKAVSMEAENVP